MGGLGDLSVLPYEIRLWIFNLSLPSAIFAVHPYDPHRGELRRYVVDNERVEEKIPEVLQILFVSKSVNRETIEAMYTYVVVNFDLKGLYPYSPFPLSVHIDRMKRINLTVDLDDWNHRGVVKILTNKELIFLMIRSFERFAAAPLPRRTFRFDIIVTASVATHIFRTFHGFFAELKKLTSVGELVVGVYAPIYKLVYQDPLTDRWRRRGRFNVGFIGHELAFHLEDSLGSSVMQTHKNSKDTNEVSKDTIIGATWTFHPRAHVKQQESLRMIRGT